MRLAILSIICASLAVAASPQETFEKRCTGCHALDKIKTGPPLRNIYGRKAGTDPQFVYSEAVKKASLTWDESTLDRWLTDTESVIPGNEMAFRLNDPTDRANIIAYLRKLQEK